MNAPPPRPPLADDLLGVLTDPEAGRRWLSALGVRDPERGYRDLHDLARGEPRRLLIGGLLAQLQHLLPACPDAGMALTNLERYLAACDQPETMLSVLTLDPKTTEILVQLFSTSQYFSEQMIADSALIYWLRAGAARRDRDRLIDDLWGELAEARNDDQARSILRRFRHREMLRIGYTDIIRGQPLEVVTDDLSHLAEACVEGAYRVAKGHAEAKHGRPLTGRGTPASFVVLALGKLGGEELNYSSDIDLIFLYDEEGATDGPKPIANAEFFARMGGEIVRLLSDHSALGTAYRVDMRLRPEGNQGPLARSLAATLGYYETSGRTWERQALIKCRPVAGDRDLGRRFLAAIAPFVYRRYLSAAEIAEIKAMKRKIESRTLSSGHDDLEVKTGRGGIRDVEFVVQFLQLLHGGANVEVRHHQTLRAMSKLEQAGCLTAEERGVMEETYRFLRRVEHRLQAMFDRQIHTMPADPEGLRVLAIRMGYPPATPWEDRTGPAQRFQADYRAKTEQNRRILNHLLHDAFRDDQGTPVDPAVDLVLDPEPTPELVDAALGRYPFRDRAVAHRNLMALAKEDFPFLSQARCRHFLAAIAPRLLRALAAAPDPDMALTNLEKVSASLGAKAILWELFSVNPPTLRLYVELCATSQFLSEILITNPGMIDDLMDSLVDDRPQTGAAIREELAELCKGAEDLGPILLGFRNKEWVRIGTRDILGREPIRVVTRELADVAEAIVDQVAADAWADRVRKYGEPRREADAAPVGWAIVALGKLGGRELSYNSDLDLIFLYEAGGQAEGRGGTGPIANDRFFVELAQRVLKALTVSKGAVPLYAIDTRLRPHGGSGTLALPLDEFRRYFREVARPWERLALTRARVIHARGDFDAHVGGAIGAILTQPIHRGDLAEQVLGMRRRLEEAASPDELKRGFGGLVDIEFVIQFLQLAHAAERPEILRTNVWDALDALLDAGLLDGAAHRDLRDAYDFRRAVESRLRIVHNRASAELPADLDDLGRLARRLGYDRPGIAASFLDFQADAARHAERTRALFLQTLTDRSAP